LYIAEIWHLLRNLTSIKKKISKNVMFLILSSMFFLLQNQKTGEQNRFWGRGIRAGGVEGGGWHRWERGGSGKGVGG
jgi:hypothetical protein